MPIIVRETPLAVKLSQVLFERGINVAPATFPGVPMDGARLRFFLTAEHTTEQIDIGLDAVREELDRLETVGFNDNVSEVMAKAGLSVGKA